MMFEVIQTTIPGCVEIRPRVVEDARGRFIKTFHQEAFAAMEMNTEWAEEYYSVSRRYVLRGLHFQLPPHDHDKLVYCTDGEIWDAVVDLRQGSPAFGRYGVFHLSGEEAAMVYIPKGIAHGFLALSERATVMYKVSTIYAPQHDSGILWNSAGIPWPIENPTLSERDRNFVPLAAFRSPFSYRGGING
jgi:dTDP-4-dehydrorhamnose 3,5-epimerase